MEERTAQIDTYLSGSMTSEEEKAFELALENDLELRKDVDLQKKTFALLEAAAFIETKDKIRAINQQKSTSSFGGMLLKVAAVLLVLVIPTYFLLNNQFNDEHLFADYSEPYPDRITTMGSSDETKLTEAMSAYNKEEYIEAAKLFKVIRLNDSENDKVILYEAVSLTYSDQAKKAVDLLEIAMKPKSANFISLEWQMVLSLLANNQGDDAKDVLAKFLEHNNGYQQIKAEALLTDLNRIWR
ncbi:MAG: hypothetical protein HRT58_09495 [Crocinitomicaceae bacterium]|nr:hypothetical protein [Flavobacteriales bacterium]NQZ35888.1 hypothetical protein [Crocinitomicaceae bacterium]